MPINNIPGVGPTNADIATAVAAPSAATIAAAVAAPSAATIAAAVAAPSAATIASTVAASVPTLSQINTSVANNAPSPNAWVLLGTGNMQSVNSATVSFSAYKKLRIVWKFSTSGSDAQAPLIRFNGDTGANYTEGAIVRIEATSPTVYRTFSNSSFRCTIGNLSAGNGTWGYMIVEDANSTSAHKQVTAMSSGHHSSIGAPGSYDMFGIYRSTSPITSVSITGNGAVAFSSDSINAVGFQVFGAN